MSELTAFERATQEEMNSWQPTIPPVGSGTSKSSKSESQKMLFSALAKMQSTVGGAKKDALNPHFQSKYADLSSVWEAIREPLTSNGLCLLQELHPCEGGLLLEATLGHISGEWRSSTAYFPIESAKITNPQVVMSALTYARRGQLMALVGIAPIDDDGEGAVRTKPAKADEKVLAHQAWVRDNWVTVATIKDSIAIGELGAGAGAWFELDDEEKKLAWLAPTAGGVFSTKERDTIKSSEFRIAHYGDDTESNGELVPDGEPRELI